MIRACSASLMAPQPAISSSVRAQPRQTPRCGSIWHTLTQGDFKP